MVKSLTGHTDSVLSLVFLRSEELASSSGSSDGSVKIWNLQSKQVKKSFQRYKSSVTSMAVVSDNFLATSDTLNITNIWDLASDKLIKVLSQHQNEVYATATLSENYIVTGSKDRNLVFYQWS